MQSETAAAGSLFFFDCLRNVTKGKQQWALFDSQQLSPAGIELKLEERLGWGDYSDPKMACAHRAAPIHFTM